MCDGRFGTMVLQPDKEHSVITFEVVGKSVFVAEPQQLQGVRR
jgi:hypothetical protein